MADFAFNPSVASGISSEGPDVSKAASKLIAFNKYAKDQSRVVNTPYPPPLAEQSDVSSDAPNIGTSPILGAGFNK